MAMDMKPAQDQDDGSPLSAERMAEIHKKVEQKVAKERARAAEAAYEARLENEMRAQQNELTGDPEEDRLVNITIRVSDSATGMGSNGEGLHGIKLNGFVFNHGQTYQVPLHKARVLQDIAYRTEVAERMREDKPMSEFYRKPRATVVTGRNGQVVGVSGAPQATGTHIA